MRLIKGAVRPSRDRLHWRLGRRWCGFWVAVALLISVSAPVVALAAETTSAEDLIGGKPVSTAEVLAEEAPSVDMAAGILMTEDGVVLWERNADSERAMASTTKIMTALLTVENVELSDVVTITIEAAEVGESSIPMTAGDTMTVETLLEATLVHSANNAAFALAEYVGGDTVKFVEMMNERAEELGLTHTHFTNPHGLDQEGHYTSAHDLATLARIALDNETFAQIVGVDMVRIGSYNYENTNELIGSYEGATGVKTGYTDDAGYCVVASAERNGIGLVAVVLGATSDSERFSEAEELLDWGFQHYATAHLVTAETTAALVPVDNYLDMTVAAVVATDVALPIFDLGEAITLVTDLPDAVEAPLDAGEELGTLSVMQGSRVLTTVPLVAASDVNKPDAWSAVKIWLTRLWRGVFGGQVEAAAVPLM